MCILIIYLAFTLVVSRSKLYVGNLSVLKIYIIRPKPGPVAKNATPRPLCNKIYFIYCATKYILLKHYKYHSLAFNSNM